MRPGTPGFIGERLREAREARGVNGVALSEMLGVTRQAVSQYENGTVTPAPEILERMALVLNVPERFFWRPVRRATINTVFYRSFASATKTARLRAERRYGWLKEITSYLEQYIELPTPEFPDAAPDLHRLTSADIESIAAAVRAEFALGVAPIPDMVVVLENHGAIVSRFDVGTETLDAFSEWSAEESRPYVILSADKNSAVRSRLDAAHELGHMVLHRHTPPSLLIAKEGFDFIESQAKRFGAAFLLPAQEFSDDFFYPTLAELKRLKDKWGASMAMILKRCEDLDLLPEKEITRLWVALSRGGRKREAGDDELEPEQPRVLRDSFDLLLQEGERSRAQIKDDLPFSVHDIEALAGLPAGFFEEPRAAAVVELKVRASSAELSGQGRVVPFPRKS